MLTVPTPRKHRTKKYVSEYPNPTRIALLSLRQHQTEARTMGHFRLAPTKETSAGPCLLREGEPKKEKKREASKSQPVCRACGSFSAPFLSVCPRLDPRCYVEHEPVELVIHTYEQRQLSFFPSAFMHALSRVFSLSLFSFPFLTLEFTLLTSRLPHARKYVHAPMLAMPHATQNE